jgi:4-hydroxy-3-methylbut-2-enyl diphosphate reductase
VSQNCCAIRNQCGTPFADIFTDGQIFLLNKDSLLFESLANLIELFIAIRFSDPLHPLQSPEEVDRSRAGSSQHVTDIAQLAEKGYAIVIHGKESHEETRATFSHAGAGTPTVIVNDMKETTELAKYITGEKKAASFYEEFKGRYSKGFDITKDLQRIGVVNQTTQLATDTQAISDYLKQIMIRHFADSGKPVSDFFADTRDTLCYATNDNQTAAIGLVETKADLAIVIGGYNSSNTTHLVELCEKQLPTYFISGPEKIIDKNNILHFDYHKKEELTTQHFLSSATPIKILITSGASCPDSIVEAVIDKVASFYNAQEKINELKNSYIVSL